jgi:uncharacterized protein involved in response to NO
MLFANAGQFWLSLTASLWCLAFALFVIVFAPILCRSRIDGKLG